MGSKGEHQEILQVFLWSFDAHFFIAFLPFGAVLSRKFSPYFVAGISKVSFRRLLRFTSDGNADRSRSFGLLRLGTIIGLFSGSGDTNPETPDEIRILLGTIKKIYQKKENFYARITSKTKNGNLSYA